MSYSDRWTREYLARRDAGLIEEPPAVPDLNPLGLDPAWLRGFQTTAPKTASPQPVVLQPLPATLLPLPGSPCPAAPQHPAVHPAPVTDTDLVAQARALREQRHLSQQAFAAHLGISVRTLQDWEQGRRRPRGPAQALLRQHLERLAAAP